MPSFGWHASSRTGRAASVLTTTGRRDITVRRRVTDEVANRRSPGTVRRGDTSGRRCCPSGQHENQENHNDHSAVFHHKLWGSDPGSAQGEGGEGSIRPWDRHVHLSRSDRGPDGRGPEGPQDSKDRAVKPKLFSSQRQAGRRPEPPDEA